MLDKANAPAEVLPDQGRGAKEDNEACTDGPTSRKPKRKLGNERGQTVAAPGQTVAAPRAVSLGEKASTAAPATVYSRRETDEDYERVIARTGSLRVVKCPDDIQLIVQSFRGGRWRNKSYHRHRYSLVRRYGPLLPDDDFDDRCNICGRDRAKPRSGLPRHLFCRAGCGQ